MILVNISLKCYRINNDGDEPALRRVRRSPGEVGYQFNIFLILIRKYFMVRLRPTKAVRVLTFEEKIRLFAQKSKEEIF